MIRAHLSSFARHFLQRARAVLSSPAALLVMLSFGAAAALLWPESTSLPARETPIAQAFERSSAVYLDWILWLFLWPSLPALYSRGQAAGRGGTTSLAAAASPPLPVHPSTRTVAEGLLALLATAFVRVGLLIVFGDQPLAQLLRDTAAGAMVVFPVLLAWALGSTSLNLLMLRPVATAAILAFLSLRWNLGWAPLGAASLALSILVLESRRLEELNLDLRWSRSAPQERRRRAPGARRQLFRDTWQQPLSGWFWGVGSSVALYVLMLGLDLVGKAGEYGFFIAFEVFLVVFLQLLLRPLGSTLAMEGLVGKHGAKRGDFLRAWAVLPVAPQTILRQVWLHGLVYGLVLWGLPTLMLAVRTRLSTGVFGLRAADGGDLSELVLAAALVVPMLAGFMVAACAGRKLETLISGFSLLLAVHTVLVARIVLDGVFGRGSLAADLGTAAYALVLVALASLFPLRLLRREAIVGV